MHTRLVLTLLLAALLLEPAAAASPSLEATIFPVAMESFYPDPDGILSDICDLCIFGAYYCTHGQSTSLDRTPTFTAETFLGHPEWPSDGLLPKLETSAEEEQLDPALPLTEYAIQGLDHNATSMLPTTMQILIEGTYLPGDRLAAQAVQRRQIQRRRAARPGGFPCTVEGCGTAFDRLCDLNRHQKRHLGRSERPHKCSICREGFLYPKDRTRHERTHDELQSPQAVLHCHIPGCNNTDGFSRRDNLRRHQRRQHPHVIASA